jgi:hypothetical protein
MATPIKPTPVLYGEDAARFEKRMQNPPKLSKKEKEEQRKAYELVKSRTVGFQW